MTLKLMQKLKEEDYKAIERSEKKYKKLFDASASLWHNATEIANILSDLNKKDKEDFSLDYEIILEILNDVSFAGYVMENCLLDSIINLTEDTSILIKKRIYLAIENYVVYWNEMLTK